MKFLLSLTVICSIFGCKSQTCPSSSFNDCANENGHCSISPTINDGYISYGVDGRWSLIPFTNTGSTRLQFRCDNSLGGDVNYNKGKYCCYIAADTGINAQNFWDDMVENKGGWQMDSTWSMRYGAENRFVYRVMDGATGWCNNGFFGDSTYNKGKRCKRSNDRPASIPSSASKKWRLCGNEGGICSSLDTSAAQWVRYGNGLQKHYMRLIISSKDGTIPCNNDLFGDPSYNERKYCYAADAEYTFSALVGQWTELQSCVGCSESKYTKFVGVTHLTEHELTETWTTSLTATLQAGFEFFGSVEMSTQISNSVTNRMLSSFSHTESEESSFTCSKDILYQWTIGATQNNGISTKSFSVKGEDLMCMDNPLRPVCPPGYCSDETCQTCTTPNSFRVQNNDNEDLPQAVFVENENDESKKYNVLHSDWFIALVFLVPFCCIATIMALAWHKFCGKRHKQSDYVEFDEFEEANQQSIHLTMMKK